MNEFIKFIRSKEFKESRMYKVVIGILLITGLMSVDLMWRLFDLVLG